MKKDVFEKCHLRFCRFALGVNKRAPNLGIYGDTGRYPIFISCAVQFLKYWHRLGQLDNSSELLYNAYTENVRTNSDWMKAVVKLLCTIRTTHENALRMKRSTLVKLVTKHFMSSFETGWKAELFNDDCRGTFGNKLRYYRTFKWNFATEPYLQCKNTTSRKNISRLRLSCHRLQIELGRYARGESRLQPEERICKLCNTECEDEFHFMCRCPKFSVNRENMYKGIGQSCRNFASLSLQNEFIYLMSSEDKCDEH